MQGSSSGPPHRQRYKVFLATWWEHHERGKSLVLLRLNKVICVLYIVIQWWTVCINEIHVVAYYVCWMVFVLSVLSCCIAKIAVYYTIVKRVQDCISVFLFFKGVAVIYETNESLWKGPCVNIKVTALVYICSQNTFIKKQKDIHILWLTGVNVID